jgi:hypothetical protein
LRWVLCSVGQSLGTLQRCTAASTSARFPQLRVSPLRICPGALALRSDANCGRVRHLSRSAGPPPFSASVTGHWRFPERAALRAPQCSPFSCRTVRGARKVPTHRRSAAVCLQEVTPGSSPMCNLSSVRNFHPGCRKCEDADSADQCMVSRSSVRHSGVKDFSISSVRQLSST